jgi:hypothetical protein
VRSKLATSFDGATITGTVLIMVDYLVGIAIHIHIVSDTRR